jgi:hypothetical protein
LVGCFSKERAQPYTLLLYILAKSLEQVTHWAQLTFLKNKSQRIEKSDEKKYENVKMQNILGKL